MKACWIFALLTVAMPAFALNGNIQNATVTAMRKVPCKVEQSNPNHVGLVGQILGTSAEENVGGCIEYELHTEKVRYIICPRVAILLQLGSNVTISLTNGDLLLHVAEAPKPVRCIVLAMTLRADGDHNNSFPCADGRDEPCSGQATLLPRVFGGYTAAPGNPAAAH